MGYYSQLYFDLIKVKVDTKRLVEVEKFFSSGHKDVYGFADVYFEVSENGELQDIVLQDYWDKFYDDELFAEKLSEAILEGQVDLQFNGEDGTQWCYRVSKNKVEELHSVWLTQAELKKVIEYLRK